MKLLHIKVSPNITGSSSRAVSNILAEKLKNHYSGLVETVLDLSETPLPHLDAFTIGSFFTMPENRTSEQCAAIERSEEMVNLLLENDLIIISSPMWNLGLPSVLKAWFDHITRAGRTFGFTDEGTKFGLVTGKKVYVVVASGSMFTNGPFMNDDQFSPYIKTALAYVGITDVQFIRIDGTHDPRSRETALPDAIKFVNQLVIN
ncbi:FMN-dependent NADH-azoreductase [Mixta theicola]|uniref:FMN dependent NADH:quinone oxidoreductase n=1 Tax=Mixta theicola TaxID=1458355 RepID=A0A2K1QE09_9GAMM|nr:NAD(P)H-dependent oxidoreductase [Mixta theicola]PNS13262.1 FMN-dependent NADH-azoreductase [Mixta theicola]GLR08981.1 FMN-dependent NADH-azoreductase [Mixta theicola]